MYNKDKFTIYAIIDSIDIIEKAIQKHNSPATLFEDRITFDAILMNFIIIGEMANKMGDEIKNISPDIKWNMIKGLRNIIAHDYFGIDADVVWEIIKNDLPQLKRELKKLKN